MNDLIFSDYHQGFVTYLKSLSAVPFVVFNFFFYQNCFYRRVSPIIKKNVL